uniref:NET domain-containing protein n=1 Tax=viral metagenome TaxID=1070528 RepID=A0A6C0KPV8_9ZZZZ
MTSSGTSLIHLFNSLKKDVQKENFPNDKREALLKHIALLDEKGQEMLYVIIKYHQLETKKDAIDQLPYESKFVSKNIRFDIEKFPNDLKYMIEKFVSMHLSLMEDEKNRFNLEKSV